jgi:hypothetical protein
MGSATGLPAGADGRSASAASARCVASGGAVTIVGSQAVTP